MLSLARSKVTVSFSVSPLRETVSVALSPAEYPRSALRSASPEETAVSSMAVMMSPAFRPAFSAQLPLLTALTYAPFGML